MQCIMKWGTLEITEFLHNIVCIVKELNNFLKCKIPEGTTKKGREEKIV